jgi:hypothetical protein
LRGELAVDPSEMDANARETAGNVTPVTAVAKVSEEGPPLTAAEEQFLATAELPAVLILTPVKDAAAHLPRFLTNLRTLSYPRGKLSLGFLESDSRDDTYAVLAAARPGLAQDFRQVTLLKRDFDFRPAGARWAVGIQRQRRATLARSRNALLQAALRDEAWVLWIDSDMASWPEDIIQRLLAARKPIVVPNCLRGMGEAPYDLNSFRLTADASQLDWSPYIIDGLLQPPKHFGREYLTDLRGEALVELDGVGATMLLVDADLHREGLIFPPFSYEGLIESEGLARMAREMGVGSWGLPDLIVRHE